VSAITTKRPGRNGKHPPPRILAAPDDRLPPLNLEAERGLIASVVHDETALDAAKDLRADDFYRDLHQRIWRVFLKMRAAGRAIDAITAFEALESEGVSFDEFDEIIDSVPHATNAAAYVSIVLEKARRRAAIEVCQRMMEAAYTDMDTAADVVRRGMAFLAPIADVATGGGLSAIGGREFMSRRYDRDFIVRGMLVRGRPTILAGPKKSLKTTLSVELAVCMATASDFLDSFRVTRPNRVLLVSAESGEATLQETCRRVCRNKGLDPDLDLGGLFFAFDLPRLDSADDLAALGEFIRTNEIEVVILDPLYLMLISGTSDTEIDAANLFHTGPLLRRIAEACLSAGATPILVHHFKKTRSDPFGMPELDDLAYAGLAEFARQWILLGRRAPYVSGTGNHELWMVAGGSDGHGGEWAIDLHEGIIDDDFADRDWRVSVRPASQARQEAQEAATDAKADVTRAKDEARKQRIAEDAERAWADLVANGPATGTAWRNRFGWDGNRMGPIRERLLVAGRVVPTTVEIPCGQSTRQAAGFKAVAGTPGDTGGTPGGHREPRVWDAPGGTPGEGGGSPPFRGEPPTPRVSAVSRGKSNQRGTPGGEG
jgi:replicative DNA helicase